MNVALSIIRLLSRIEPLQSEVNRARFHTGAIKSRLEKSFRLRKFITVGSHSRGTAIRHYSDVDYFAVLSRDDARWGGAYISSATFLNKVKEDLSYRFWQTGISRDGQAVVARFAGGEHSVDIVPAIFLGMNSDNWPIYQIPDGEGDWIETSPEIHNRFILRANFTSRGKLRRTTQLIKFWRECRTPRVPISSFHIEILLASYKICEGFKSYSQCLTELFQLLAERGCRSFRDPLGISGNLRAVRTEAQRDFTLREVIYARNHAKKAFYTETLKNHNEACRQWDIVFNGEFPY
jgi:hypothetical protein